MKFLTYSDEGALLSEINIFNSTGKGAWV
jgi:hypothetical protein